jgi:hydrogenase maturation protease
MANRTAKSSACSLLVIGYGNELRSDDGVGPRVAAAVERLQLSGVRTLVCHQLTPELADPVSQAERVVFVDASVEPENDVQLRELQPGSSGEVIGHSADPRAVLGLARDLFGHCPEAWWLTVPIENTGFGEGLSALAQNGLQTAVEKIKAIARASQNQAE